MLQISQSYLQVRENSGEVVPKWTFLIFRSSSRIPIASTYFDYTNHESVTDHNERNCNDYFFRENINEGALQRCRPQSQTMYIMFTYLLLVLTSTLFELLEFIHKLRFIRNGAGVGLHYSIYIGKKLIII